MSCQISTLLFLWYNLQGKIVFAFKNLSRSILKKCLFLSVLSLCDFFFCSPFLFGFPLLCLFLTVEVNNTMFVVVPMFFINSPPVTSSEQEHAALPRFSLTVLSSSLSITLPVLLQLLKCLYAFLSACFTLPAPCCLTVLPSAWALPRCPALCGLQGLVVATA